MLGQDGVAIGAVAADDQSGREEAVIAQLFRKDLRLGGVGGVGSFSPNLVEAYDIGVKAFDVVGKEIEVYDLGVALEVRFAMLDVEGEDTKLHGNSPFIL